MDINKAAPTNGCSDSLLHQLIEAVKKGDVQMCKCIIEASYDQNQVNKLDRHGYSPLHWSCIAGHAAVTRYLLDLGADVDCASESNLGVRPIHCACTYGHTLTVDILLQGGADIDAKDNYGRTPLILAVQNDYSLLVAFLMSKNAGVDITDIHGETALHWSAHKGCQDITRILINGKSDPNAKDNFDQTPLHLAAAHGSIIVIEMIIDGGGDINSQTEDGYNPIDIAERKKHDHAAIYLKKKKVSEFGCNWRAIIIGPGRETYLPFAFMIISLICIGYPMYALKLYAYVIEVAPQIHLLFLLCNVTLWIFLILTYSTNPGYIPRISSLYEKALKEVHKYEDCTFSNNPLQRLCHTCKIIKPLRAKHCRVCDRCVGHFDHHCPYVLNCVGYRNRAFFLVFVASCCVACAIAVYFAIAAFRVEEFSWTLTAFIAQFSFLLFLVVGLLLSHIYLASANLTTNEFMNSSRYPYLRNSFGLFRNPFHRGVLFNCFEHFHLIRPFEFDSLNVNGKKDI